MTTQFDLEESGKLREQTEEELAALDKLEALVGYFHGTVSDGRPYWAYLLIKPSKYKEFYELTTARKPLVPTDYGTIIASGYDAAPPPEVVKEMREKYDFDNNYETKIKEEAEKQQKVFLDKKEEDRMKNIINMLQKKEDPK